MRLLELFKANGVDFEPGRREPDSALPRLLMIHGAGGSARSYLPQLSGIKNANPVAVSLPGHGNTPGPGRDTIAAYADWLCGLLSRAGQRVILLGHSMGGAIAMQCALTVPELVRGLVLTATGAKLPVLPSILEGIGQDFSRTVRQIIRFAYADGARPQWLEAGASEMSAVGPEVLSADFSACDAFDLSESLGGITCPVQLVYGGEDRLTPPKYGRFLAERITGANLSVIPGAGHMVFLEKHIEYNRTVDDFCLRLGAS